MAFDRDIHNLWLALLAFESNAVDSDIPYFMVKSDAVSCCIWVLICTSDACNDQIAILSAY